MKEIGYKLLELQELLKFPPQECKGDSKEASDNRRAWVHIRRCINDLMEEYGDRL